MKEINTGTSAFIFQDIDELSTVDKNLMEVAEKNLICECILYIYFYFSSTLIHSFSDYFTPMQRSHRHPA